MADHAAQAVDEARQSDCPWCVAVSVDLVACVGEIKDSGPLQEEKQVPVSHAGILGVTGGGRETSPCVTRCDSGCNRWWKRNRSMCYTLGFWV